MKLQKFALLLASMLVITSAFADYSVKIPVPTEIKFSNSSPTLPETPTEPTEPAYDFSEYKGIGVIESVDSTGFIESSNISSMWLQRVLFRSFNDHSLWLLGNQQEMMDNATSVTITINGDAYSCEIYSREYQSYKNQSVLGCSTTGYDGRKYSVGQQFNVEFN
ncbi:hypothetical protein E6W26_29155 [Pseudomonas aeruginosa]|uniref:hypothetical protein n=1 Tax=Pseudomonas aeruginosa TaxID=287 RepID=UPI00109DC16B|nr:hypothetical protein [Pseudomonas aeruginosa]EKV1241256.1 hypothetical protein [Pseudomonas aeruginosa]EKV8586165.1 hypothetical protein [Pseudomonas aeruginosa]ELN5407383.1 hypothetical protein [Pseudomonas aeruginosa]ELP1438574.1 hypothetical protein [Pseudomonas aeruginosa]THB16468.1 hypothetical protein E6W26_29155 [Pseudomonas aeruginosa]